MNPFQPVPLFSLSSTTCIYGKGVFRKIFLSSKKKRNLHSPSFFGHFSWQFKKPMLIKSVVINFLPTKYRIYQIIQPRQMNTLSMLLRPDFTRKPGELARKMILLITAQNHIPIYQKLIISFLQDCLLSVKCSFLI